MEDEVFNAKHTGFWGVLASIFSSLYAYFRYQATKQKTKQAEISLALKLGEKMEEKKGIKELSEVIVAIGVVGALVAKKAKDGIQVQDAVDVGAALLLDPEVKAAISAAADKISEVKDELKDIDLGEGLDVAKLAIDNAQKIIAALK